eukprot:1606465-Rhodomonas_salina.1
MVRVSLSLISYAHLYGWIPSELCVRTGAANSYTTSRVCCEQTLDGFGSTLQSIDDGQASIQAHAATDLSQDMACLIGNDRRALQLAAQREKAAEEARLRGYD